MSLPKQHLLRIIRAKAAPPFKVTAARMKFCPVVLVDRNSSRVESSAAWNSIFTLSIWAANSILCCSIFRVVQVVRFPTSAADRRRTFSISPLPSWPLWSLSPAISSTSTGDEFREAVPPQARTHMCRPVGASSGVLTPRRPLPWLGFPVFSDSFQSTVHLGVRTRGCPGAPCARWSAAR